MQVFMVKDQPELFNPISTNPRHFCSGLFFDFKFSDVFNKQFLTVILYTSKFFMDHIRPIVV